MFHKQRTVAGHAVPLDIDGELCKWQQHTDRAFPDECQALPVMLSTSRTSKRNSKAVSRPHQQQSDTVVRSFLYKTPCIGLSGWPKARLTLETTAVYTRRCYLPKRRFSHILRGG